MIDRQSAVKRRNGTLHTFGTFADTARNANRIESRSHGDIQPIGINEILRIGDFTTERDGVTALRRLKAASLFVSSVAIQR